MERVVVVGTGLIGASFGLALRSAGFRGAILGVSSPPAVAEAVASGAIDRGAPLAEAVPGADLVYLAQPIRRILQTLEVLDPLLSPGCLVTDAGSTKGAIVRLARTTIRRGIFLGGHPMAGKEVRGASAAEAALFHGRTWVLTPADPADLQHPVTLRFAGWLEKIGARVVVLDPEEHDRIVAHTSHLPQLASTALASLLGSRLASPRELAAAGPGLLDSTRLALSPFDIWDDIIATNTGPVREALAAYIARLSDILSRLQEPSLGEDFAAAAAFAARLRNPR